MRTSALPSTSRRPVTASTALCSWPGKRSCSLRWRGIRGLFGVVDWSGSSQGRASTIAEGMPRWYSSEESEEKPSSPISSSEYSPPSGRRNWVCRFGGTSPTCRECAIGELLASGSGGNGDVTAQQPGHGGGHVGSAGENGGHVGVRTQHPDLVGTRAERLAQHGRGVGGGDAVDGPGGAGQKILGRRCVVAHEHGDSLASQLAQPDDLR